jgi:hypothetical protein
MFRVMLGKPIDIIRSQDLEIQLPFCCDNPEPAYLFGTGSDPGTRSQGIDCTSCSTPLVRLTWTPPGPYQNECHCPPGACVCLEVPEQVERVEGPWKPGMPIPDEPGPPPVK